MTLPEVVSATKRFPDVFERTYHARQNIHPEQYPEDLPIIFWVYIYSKFLENYLIEDSHE